MLPKILAENRLQLDGAVSAAATNPFPVVAGYSDKAQYQILSNWCWAATGAAICDFFLGSGAGDHRYQCANASTYISGASGCCTLKIKIGFATITLHLGKELSRMSAKGAKPIHFDAKTPCNKGGRAFRPIEGTGQLTTNEHSYATSGPTSAELTAVDDELRGNRPVIRRIAWNSGGGHATVIYGKAPFPNMYYVADPWSGFSLASKTVSGGRWRSSVFVSKTGT